MNHHNRSNRTARIVLAVALLGTGIASAQPRPTLQPRGAATALRTVTPASNGRSNAFQSLSIERAAVRPLDVKRIDVLSGSSQRRAVDVAAWPAVIMPLITPVTPEPAPVTSWMPSGLDGASRGNFTNLGIYDR